MSVIEMVNENMAKQAASKPGFIAALDQSGGSTPKALRLYGIEESAYANDEEMFGLIHEMRARIIKSPAFKGDKVIFRTRPLDLLSKVPGTKEGALVLNVKRKDRRVLAAFLDRLDLWVDRR